MKRSNFTYFKISLVFVGSWRPYGMDIWMDEQGGLWCNLLRQWRTNQVSFVVLPFILSVLIRSLYDPHIFVFFWWHMIN